MAKKKSLMEQFEEIACPDADGYSKRFLIDDLVQINPKFQCTNGGGWCRSDGPLGRKYHIRREKSGGRIVSVQLDGRNNTPKERGISKTISEEIRKQRCAVLDIGKDIECDHKNGKYDSRMVASLETQQLSDFQPLSKAVNIAKRQHCKECRETGKRYDATRLGYAVGFTKGDADSPSCAGCYWNDPRRFNAEISAHYHKPY